MITFFDSTTGREAPEVEIYSRNPQIVHVGESAQLSCRAIAGTPKPHLTWMRSDGNPFSRNVKETQAGTIVISHIAFADAGEYECRGSNSAGESSHKTTLTVHQPPVIRILPDVSELKLTEGDELKLKCFVEGLPLPTVTWIEPKPFEVSASTSEPESHSTPAPPPIGFIHKYNISNNDAGIYVCNAKNDVGESQKDILIIIKQKRVGTTTPQEKIQTGNAHPKMIFFQFFF